MWKFLPVLVLAYVLPLFLANYGYTSLSLIVFGAILVLIIAVNILDNAG